MTTKAGWATPMFHVRELEGSIGFYELLGFQTIDTDRCHPLGWARLHCEGGAIMFLRAEEGHAVDPSVQGVSLTMYTPDLKGMREQLIAWGVAAREISYPVYLPSGEMQLMDPDGYRVAIVHWGKEEHEAWKKRIGAKGE
jgi:hypothetical protein